MLIAAQPLTSSADFAVVGGSSAKAVKNKVVAGCLESLMELFAAVNTLTGK